MGFIDQICSSPFNCRFYNGHCRCSFSSQINDLFGLNIDTTHAQFLDKWSAYFEAFSSLDWLTTVIGVGTLLFIIFVRRYVRFISWEIATILVPTLICWCFHLEIPTVLSRFGQVSLSLSLPSVVFDFSRMFDLMPDAITIALLAGIESLVCSVIADTAIGSRHKPNCELVAQGIANISSALLGGIPGTATMARTTVNIKTGAQTPIAGITHAFVVLMLLWVCSSLIALIPLASLSAILIVVSWNMSDLPHFFRLMKTSKGDVVILLTAFLLTVLVNLIIAVEVGMLLAAFLFMNRMSEVKHVIALDQRRPEQEIEIYKMRGPFFFGVTDRLKTLFYEMKKPPKIFVIRMKHVPVLDATALQALRELSDRCKRLNTQLILTEVQTEPADLLHQYGLGQLVNQNILENSELHPSELKNLNLDPAKATGLDDRN